jgi:hypothetical protein
MAVATITRIVFRICVSPSMEPPSKYHSAAHHRAESVHVRCQARVGGIGTSWWPACVAYVSEVATHDVGRKTSVVSLRGLARRGPGRRGWGVSPGRMRPPVVAEGDGALSHLPVAVVAMTLVGAWWGPCADPRRARRVSPPRDGADVSPTWWLPSWSLRRRPPSDMPLPNRYRRRTSLPSVMQRLAVRALELSSWDRQEGGGAWRKLVRTWG